MARRKKLTELSPPSSTVELAAQIKARPLPARNYQPLLGHHLAQALGGGGGVPYPTLVIKGENTSTQGEDVYT